MIDLDLSKMYVSLREIWVALPGSPYLGKTTAATRAALTTVCAVFSCIQSTVRLPALHTGVVQTPQESPAALLIAIIVCSIFVHPVSNMSASVGGSERARRC